MSTTDTTPTVEVLNFACSKCQSNRLVPQVEMSNGKPLGLLMCLDCRTYMPLPFLADTLEMTADDWMRNYPRRLTP
jgi:hypothetical protein